MAWVGAECYVRAVRIEILGMYVLSFPFVFILVSAQSLSHTHEQGLKTGRPPVVAAASLPLARLSAVP